MKYRVTAKMASQPFATVKEGDIIECDPSDAVLRLSKGYLVPADIEEAKQDKQLRHYNRKP